MTALDWWSRGQVMLWPYSAEVRDSVSAVLAAQTLSQTLPNACRRGPTVRQSKNGA